MEYCFNSFDIETKLFWAADADLILMKLPPPCTIGARDNDST